MFVPSELDASPAVLLDAIESNRIGFLARLGRIPPPLLPGGAQAEQYRTGLRSPAFNGVSRLEAAERWTEPSIGALARWWRRADLPWSFWVSDTEGNDELPNLLVSFGLDLRERLVGMGIDPREGRESAPSIPGLLIQRVTTESQLRMFLLAWTRSADAESGVDAATLGSWLRERDLRSDPSIRMLLALQDGRPAGFSLLFVEGAVTGIYAVSAARELRGRRIGSALVHAGVTAALSWNCRWAVATVPDGAAGPFLRRGFAELETVSRFALEPPRPAVLAPQPTGPT